MATAKKTVDPLVEELPEPIGPAPRDSREVSFRVLIKPYVTNGQVRWAYSITDHTHVEHIGDYSSAIDAIGGFGSEAAATEAAKNHVSTIRETLDLKFSLPSALVLEL